MSAILKSGGIEQGVRGTGDDNVTGDPIVLVHEPDESIFREVHRKVTPSDGNEIVLRLITSQINGVFRVGLVTDQSPVRGAIHQAWLITRLPVDVVGRNESKPLAGIPRILKVGAHLVRPIFRMAYSQSRLVIREHAGVFMQIDISDVGDVVAFTLQETEHIDFIREELPSASTVIVRAVERDLGRGYPSRVIGIKGLAAPGVVGLIGINAALKDVSGSA